MSAKEYIVDKKFKLVAPDGGWGYMIAFAVVLNFTTTTMFQGSFELLYMGFMKDIGMSSTHTTTILGIVVICTSISAFLTAPLLSIMNYRMLGLVAVILFNVGVLGTVFANAIFPFLTCVGILQGSGFGLLYNLSYTILVDYFVKKRVMIIGITHTLVALAAMLAPMLSKWLLAEYGYRGTMLLISGITMNNFIAVALIQPVDRHMKKVEVLDNEVTTLIKNEKLNDKSAIPPIIKINDIEASSSKTNENLSDNTAGNGIKNAFKQIVDLLFDKSLRQTFMISCACLGPALCLFSDAMYINMLPQSLYAVDWNQNDVNLAISVLRFGDLAMRIVFIFCSNWMLKLGSEEIYIVGIVVALVARLGSLWSKSLIWNLIYITLVGMAHCGITLLLPVVIADVVSSHQFSAAIGTCILMNGAMKLILGPAIGAVRDLSNSHGAAFYLLASCFAIATLFWLIELCYKKNLQKRIQRREYLKQKKLNRG